MSDCEDLAVQLEQWSFRGYMYDPQRLMTDAATLLRKQHDEIERLRKKVADLQQQYDDLRGHWEVER